MVASEFFSGQLLEAVLTLMVVSQKDVLPGHGNAHSPALDEACEPNHCRHLQGPRNRSKYPIVALHNLHFSDAQHRNRSLPGNHPQRLVSGIQKKSPIHNISY